MAISSINSNNYHTSFGRLKKTKNGNEYNSTHMMKKIFGTAGALGGAAVGTLLAAENKALKNPKAIAGILVLSAVSSLLSIFPFAVIFDAIRNNSRKNRADENARLVAKLTAEQANKAE